MSEYADKDRLEPYYSKHVDAMTVEGLPKISEIAAELAFRDRRIEKLEIRELGYIQSLRDLEARVRELEGAANKVLNTIMQTRLKSSADLLSDEWIEAVYRLESAMGESPPKAE